MFLKSLRLNCKYGTSIRHYTKKADKILPATNTLSWDTRVPVKLRMEDTAPGNLPPIRVQSMVRNTVEKHGSNTAMVSYDLKDKWTYDEYFEDIQKVAKGFLALGLEPSNGVGIMSYNNPQWFLSSMGAIFAGGLSTGIYTTNSPTTVKYIVDHAPLDIMVLENESILQELLEDQPDLKDMVKNFVLINGQDPRAATWSEMLEEGSQIDNKRLEEIEDKTAVNQACMLVYTSGTTGPPKGAMISHDNVTWSSKIAMDHYGWDQVRILSYLPLSHVAGCMIDCYMGCHTGSEVHFADKDALKGTLVENLKRVRPTRFYGVPRVFEKIAEKMQEVGRSNTGLKKKIGDWAKTTATQHHTDVRNGVKNDSLGYKVAQKLVFSKVHQALGLEQVRKYPHALASAAAPLNIDTHKYFESLDLEIIEFYGATEASGPQTTNLSGTLNRPGSVGHDYLGVHNKILHPDPEGLGEVAVRSRNIFMGYHKNQEKTLESFEDDWFRSGDLGKIDQDGFLWLTGRLKELLITSGGENIAPVPIENNILAELPRVLSTVVVIGNFSRL